MKIILKNPVLTETKTIRHCYKNHLVYAVKEKIAVHSENNMKPINHSMEKMQSLNVKPG